MRSSNDAIRSIKLWLSFVLDEEWDVQLRRDEGMDRPSAVIVPVGPVLSSGSAYVRDLQRDFQAYLWPKGKDGDPGYGSVEAESLATLLERALSQGGHGGARAMRIPVFDYDGVPWDQGLPDGAERYDFLLIEDVQIDARQDPDDDDLYTVTLKLRARWRADGDVTRFQKADGTPALPIAEVHLSGDPAP